jgi:hypothetical protein
MPDNAKFCEMCGTPFENEHTQPADDDVRDDHNNYPARETIPPQNNFGRNGYPDRAYGDRYTDDRRYYNSVPVYNNPGYNDPRFNDPRVNDPNLSPHDQKPRMSGQKKALIISGIALVLVIAISLGVIFFISRKTVSAKELQKAKDNYLPPAQAVTIDPALRDPSNDDIQFKYDDRARITSCTYSVNKTTYDQRYTYDDDQRKIDIETTYRECPVFTKELNYDRVTQPDTFEEVDGYYIRLNKDEIAVTAATEPPATAPEATEPPTEPPTEQPPEEPTDPPTGWKELYIDFLNNSDIFGSDYLQGQTGKLIHLNDDDTPELLLLTGFGAHAGTYELCWIDNGSVQHKGFAAGLLTYQEREGDVFTYIGGNTNSGWHYLKFNGSSLELSRSGSRNAIYIDDKPTADFTYEIDGTEATREEYEAGFKEGESWSKSDVNTSGAARSDLSDYIRNY